MDELDKSLQAQDWQKIIRNVESFLASQIPDHEWCAAEDIQAAYQKTSENLARDLNHLEEEAETFFPSNLESPEMTRNMVGLLRRWHLQGTAPSLASLCAFAIEKQQLDLPEDILRAVLIASVLGEVESNLAFHDNMHYRKVVAQLIRLMAVHNQIYADTEYELSSSQIAQLLIAGCIHDLGHDGKGNTMKGVFIQSRLERRSFELARPFLESAGCEVRFLDLVRTFLLCTDVTPLGDPANPMNQMKAAYRYHFLGEKHRYDTLNLDENLVVLQKDPQAAMMAVLLQEADIATSAGLDYMVTKYETAILREEMLGDKALPEHVVDFINHVCGRQFLSHAGQRLYAANMARIMALAESDVKAGNQPFPKPPHSDFLQAGFSSSGDRAEKSSIH